MRTSKDEYILPDKTIIALSQNEQPPKDAKIWNGYDYKNQHWVYQGKKDTRTLEKLKTDDWIARIIKIKNRNFWEKLKNKL